MSIILQTDRLTLRTWEDSDTTPMTQINLDKQVHQFLGVVADRQQTQAMITRWIKHYQEKGYSLYAVELKASHELIGFIGIITPNFEAHFTPAIEIGWRLSSKHWNQGYATEGAKAVLQYAFTQLGLEEIVSFTATTNLASQRVMQKIGLQQDKKGTFDHPNIDKDSPLMPHVLYRLKRSEYTSF